MIGVKNLNNKRVTNDDYKIFVHYAEENEPGQDQILEEKVLRWIEYILRKYSHCVPSKD